MKKITWIVCAFLLILFYSCTEKPVTRSADYDRYLQPGTKNAAFEQIEADRKFWQDRLAQNPDGITALSRLAGILSARFAYTGQMADLHNSDSLYRLVNNYNRFTSSGTFRAMAANCITQHRFQEAQRYIDSALKLGDDKYLTILQEIDVALELGNFPRAKQALKNLANKNSFDYLIREAKYNDKVNGDLEKAISLMEQAYNKLPENPTPALYVWIKSNLGDMYGHANRFEDSYKSYLEALEKNPHDYHALKGIAWLAFSHDKDAAGAKKILKYLQQQHPVPDYELMLADIAGYEKDTAARQLHYRNFLAAVRNGMYGDMYNKYLFNLQAGELNDADSAFAIAKKEVQNRPSPEAFGWLAWAYRKKGDLSNAVQTAGWYVERKCYEPEVLYYVGMIYEANGNKSMARKYLQQASLGSYELGPATSAKIKEALANL